MNEFQCAQGEFGHAETLSKAMITCMSGMIDAGIFKFRQGNARLHKSSRLDSDWDSEITASYPTRKTAQQLIQLLESSGEDTASLLVRKLDAKVESSRLLCFRLHTFNERKRCSQNASSCNALVWNWPENMRLVKASDNSMKKENTLFEEYEE